MEGPDAQAKQWCQEMGAAEMEEVKENWEDCDRWSEGELGGPGGESRSSPKREPERVDSGGENGSSKSSTRRSMLESHPGRVEPNRCGETEAERTAAFRGCHHFPGLVRTNPAERMGTPHFPLDRRP